MFNFAHCHHFKVIPVNTCLQSHRHGDQTAADFSLFHVHYQTVICETVEPALYLVKVENEIAYYFNNNKNQSSEYKHYTIYVYIIDVANLDLKEKYIYYN